MIKVEVIKKWDEVRPLMDRVPGFAEAWDDHGNHSPLKERKWKEISVEDFSGNARIATMYSPVFRELRQIFPEYFEPGPA